MSEHPNRTEHLDIEMSVITRKSYCILLLVMAMCCDYPEGEIICNGIYKGHCYLLIRTEHHFRDSRKACQHYRMDLAVISDSSEHQFIKDLMSVNRDVWVGLHRGKVLHTWSWVDGSLFLPRDSSFYQGWARDEPSNAHYEKCVRLAGDSDYKYGDQSCNVVNWSVCEELATFRQGKELFSTHTGPSSADMNLLRTLSEIGQLRCTVTCLKDSHCSAFILNNNHNPRNTVCEMYTVVDGEQMRNVSHFFFKSLNKPTLVDGVF